MLNLFCGKMLMKLNAYIQILQKMYNEYRDLEVKRRIEYETYNLDSVIVYEDVKEPIVDKSQHAVIITDDNIPYE